MGKVEQSTDWVNDTGSKLYYFPSINAGTLGMIDVKHNWAGGAKNLAPGAQLKNLCYLDDPASVGSVALNFDSTTGGLIFDKTSRQYLRLPAGFIPTAAMKDYMHTFWLKIDPANAGADGFSNVWVGIGATSYATTANRLIQVYPTITAGVITALTVCVRGINYSIKDYIGSLADGNLHCLSVRYQESADGTQQKGLVYLDGVLAYEGVWTGKIAYPTATINLNGIGSNLADTTPFAGRFYRARIDDLTLVSKTALQVIAEEMAAVAGRFS
ncbi:hypothetical protein R0E42_005330 [Klebsiella variicola]|uniref:hypothetical protein n=1 Tax=Klebsiella variicola TaxID=244366 RepID=UPI000E2A4609|nr:hypothetical protein [Klebsiella variicola]ELN9658199.1 hypothetical protein [Klebsiella variicola]SXF33191.1 Uncharacterised protein [Klebsiella variicola]